MDMEWTDPVYYFIIYFNNNYNYDIPIYIINNILGTCVEFGPT